MSIQFNQAITNLKPSQSVRYVEKAKTMQMAGIDVIGLGGGDPDFPTPKRICDAAYAGMLSGNTHYTFSRGLPALRDKIAEKLNLENHIRCTAANILVTPGGKPAIYTALRALLNPGDEVMVLEPAWVSYEPIIQASGGTPVHVGLSIANNYRITPEVLENALTDRTRALIINYPNNPTGRILHQDEAMVLRNFMLAHRDLVVLSDEVYEKIIYDKATHISLASYSDVADRVITVNGFSKCAAMTGWRLGYLCAPEPFLKPMVTLWQHMMTCTSGFIQEGGIAALDCHEEMADMLASYTARRDAFVGALNEIPGVSGAFPEGAFYAWMRFDLPDMDSFEICEYILDHARVAGVPGDAYGLGGDKCLRFSFANSMEDLMAAAQRIRQLLEGK